MQERRKGKLNIAFVLGLLVLLFTLITTCFTGRLFARYTTSADSGDSARVAAFVFSTEDSSGHLIDVSSVDKPGETQSFTFIVTNADGSSVSEVAESYTMDATLLGNMPLTVTIKKSDESASALELSGVVNPSGSAARTFAASQSSTHSYTMTVTWPATENDAEYSNAGLAWVELKITGTQID